MASYTFTKESSSEVMDRVLAARAMRPTGKFRVEIEALGDGHRIDMLAGEIEEIQPALARHDGSEIIIGALNGGRMVLIILPANDRQTTPAEVLITGKPR